MGVAVPLFESRDAYASKIDHSFAVAAYSTDAGGSVIVAIERLPKLSVCEARSEKLNWLRRPAVSSPSAAPLSAARASFSFVHRSCASFCASISFSASSDLLCILYPSRSKWTRVWCATCSREMGEGSGVRSVWDKRLCGAPSVLESRGPPRSAASRRRGPCA